MAAQLHSEQVLLVENNTRLLRSAAFLLTVAGFEVMSAVDGVAALEILNTQSPDIIICDTHMPNMDGYELLSWVRNQAKSSSIPFIFTSDRYGLDDLMLALDLGASDYIPKPFDIYDMLDAINRALPTHPGQRNRLAG